MEEYNITKDVFNYMVTNFLKDKEKSLLRLVNKEYRSKYKNKINIKFLIKNGNLGTLKILDIEDWSDEFMWYSIVHGQWHIVEWLSGHKIKYNRPCEYCPSYFITKIIDNNIPHISKDINVEGTMDSYIRLWFGNFGMVSKCFVDMAKVGNLYGMRWLLNFCKKAWVTKNAKDVLQEDVFIIAARYGRMDVMEWLLNPNDAVYDELKCKDFVYNVNGRSLLLVDTDEHCKYHEDTMAAATRYGNLDNLKWLYNIGCPLTASVFCHAAIHCNLDNLKWLHQNRCPWDKYLFYGAIRIGNIDNIKWLISNGYHERCDHRYSFIIAIETNNVSLMTFIIDKFTVEMEEYFYEVAVDANSLNAIKLLADIRCPLQSNKRLNNLLIERNNLELFKCLYNIGYNYPYNIIFKYIYRIKLKCKAEIIQWLLDIGMKITDKDFIFALQECSLDIIKCIYTSIKHIPEMSLNYALIGGDMNVLKWVLDKRHNSSSYTLDIRILNVIKGDNNNILLKLLEEHNIQYT
ncbi:Ankyrin-repeat protein [Orpheovirus IHUMI-LCC2]|uniref:Ankyrin-repeat protein n=1 Tax=Orpheovirus IHUMI-LCC2 TaxID=2023057 RepID=A0A2I2L4U2_9VIRU|nr:Ankyrin-repeat protein [Orpheovirus IHUMI-LCC2]SNW62575.1 Ankyrin-repeat protein [Orpheovirus IHUMI-LCC2]